MKKILGAVLLTVFFWAGSSQAAVLFFDDFEAGVKPDWGNERGSWYASGGVYNAASPASLPPAYSSVTTLPGLTDFNVELDIINFWDGGVFLRSSYNPSTGWANGVALIVLGDYRRQVYWHVVNGTTWGGTIGAASLPSGLGPNVHVRVEVAGDTYSAYLNDALTPITTLTYAGFSSGRVGLYDYSGQTFDNVKISDGSPGSAVPTPAAVWLLGAGLAALGGLRRKLG